MDLSPSRAFILPAYVLALASCGGAKQTGASTPPSPSVVPAQAAVPTQNVQPRSDPASSGAVQISDEIRRACGISQSDAFFPFDSANITKEDLTPLNQVASCFSTGPLKGRGLKLLGRADPRGETEYNMVLGQSRAGAVELYLSRKGLDKSKVSASSRGAMDATGTDEGTWAKDRRVDLLLGP